MDSTAQSIDQRIADEIGARQAQVVAAIGLLDEGATVPFIARYRKEVTAGLDDGQLRTLEDRLRYLRELEQRREAILSNIQEQGKLTPELAGVIKVADTKTRLEDLYLPYKVKRRTKGQIAREAGLEPLADALLAEPTLNPQDEAKKYVNGDGEEGKKIIDVKAALDGAKFILMEKFAENAELVGKLRTFLQTQGQASARLIDGKENDGGKFRDYYEYDELLSKIPSHRALAIFRGRNEGVLSVSVTVGESAAGSAKVVHPCEAMVARFWGVRDQGRAGDQWLNEVVHWTWQVKLLGHLETDLLGEIRERAEQGAIQVFADNLKDLLLAAPAGQKATIGLDPGLRTGVKLAVVDGTGKVLDHCAIFPTPPQKRLQEAEAVLLKLCQQHNVGLITIGNGT
ncbi:MAG: RNA-binding transcriptional accessory protein, partial [Gammaproteobacteria bacterium]